MSLVVNFWNGTGEKGFKKVRLWITGIAIPVREAIHFGSN